MTERTDAASTPILGLAPGDATADAPRMARPRLRRRRRRRAELVLTAPATSPADGLPPLAASAARARWTADPPERRAGDGDRRRALALRRAMPVVADAVAVGVALPVIAWVSAGTTALPPAAALLIPVALAIAVLVGLHPHDVPLAALTVSELPRLLNWAVLTVACVILAGNVGAFPHVTANGALVGIALALAAAFVGRAAGRALVRRALPAERALVVGGGDLARAVRRKLALEPGQHLDLVTAEALVDSVLAGSADARALRHAVEVVDADRVILALDEVSEPALESLVQAARELALPLTIVPPGRAALGSGASVEHLGELPIVNVHVARSRAFQAAAKRAMDLFGASVGIVLTAPLMLAIAVAVRLDSHGSALFVQTRAGRHGRPFRIYKFRTMCADAEERLAELLTLDELPEPMYKLRCDPRVTRVGRFLRATSLDELPQLWNVLRGEMSLVGPRPEATWLVERYDEDALVRLGMRPGITGPMQVHGRGELTFRERIALERDYVEHYSLWRDVQILLRTIAIVTHRQGAF